jgi:hypothetical protein
MLERGAGGSGGIHPFLLFFKKIKKKRKHGVGNMEKHPATPVTPSKNT